MARRRLPALVTVRAFEAFSRTGTVRGAADELAVSHTVVSRHIQNLEEAVGIALVRKDGRGLKPTREGERFAAKARKAFDLLEEATAELAHGRGEAIHICCMVGLASHRLLARLPMLEASLGSTEVILQPTSTRPDLGKDEADAEIVYLEAPETSGGLRSELLVRPRILAVASPALLARHPKIATPANLLQLPLLHEKSTALWETWLGAQGVAEIPPLRGPRLWHGHLTLEAARLGQGVALVSDLICWDRIKAGELVEVVPSSIQMGGYYFVAPAAKWSDPMLTIVRRWLAATLSVPGK
jgi:LysR family transcriptional regulator, glycine cleavage system transcriptional activator